jgi:SAM-dependent MidA family methyltransferase
MISAVTMSLEQIIIQTIQRNGPISFRDFMEMALYYPDLGYYTSEGSKIGAQGDFYTSCTYTSLFGKLVARQLEEMYEKIDAPFFTIVEYGAGTGMLCRDILDHFKNNAELYSKLHYCIIEKSERMRQKEKNIATEKVRWYDDIKEIGPFEGCVISNELVDNFSVHQVLMCDELMEVFVGYDNGFIEILKPACQPLRDYLNQLEVELPKGFRTEINLDAIRWTEVVAATLRRGFVLTIDYGFPSAQLYDQRRSEGTLVCYHKHTRNYCPYINIGSQDITTHVNFSALNQWGIKNGLQLNGFTNQAYFLFGLGLGNQLATTASEGGSAVHLRDFVLDMGTKLKVLIQQKGVGTAPLMGLRFPLQLT